MEKEKNARGIGTNKTISQSTTNIKINYENGQNIKEHKITTEKTFDSKERLREETTTREQINTQEPSPLAKEGNLKKQYNSQDNGSLLSKYINNKRKETSVFIDTDAATGFRKITNKRTGETREDTLNKIAYLREKIRIKRKLDREARKSTDYHSVNDVYASTPYQNQDIKTPLDLAFQKQDENKIKQIEEENKQRLTPIAEKEKNLSATDIVNRMVQEKLSR